jgi:hypothetical protein
MKNKNILIIFFIFVFLFLNSGFVQALEIKDYPKIPGLISPTSACTGSDCLSIFIAYWFGVLVYIAGILALISFAVGAVGLINPNIEAHNDAKDRMKGSILGLVLTLAAVIILRTINPTFVTPSLTPLPGVAGVFYTNGSEKKPVGLEVSDVKNRGEELISGGFNSIIYECSDKDLAPALLVWEFSGKGLSDFTNVKVIRKNCGETEPISNLGSFKMAFDTPGIYYCLGGCGSNKMCEGYMSKAIPSSENTISDEFRGKIKGVRIVNGSSNGPYYGVILHETEGLENGGNCSFPIINTNSGFECFSRDSENKSIEEIEVSAADIFTLNNDISAGDGVDFYSESFGDTGVKGLNAGFYKVADQGIQPPAFKKDADKICFDYTNVNVKDSYKYKCSDSKCGHEDINFDTSTDSSVASGQKCGNTGDPLCPSGEVCSIAGKCIGENECIGYGCVGGVEVCSDSACETLQDCPGSIDIKGSYLVGVYSTDLLNNAYCQTFKNSVKNLAGKNIISPGSEDIGEIYIIPIN